MSIGSAIGARFDSIEERDCPDLKDCIGEIHGLMYTALLAEPTDEFAYALWVEDDDEAMPVYVMQKDPDRIEALMTLMTPDVADMFTEEDENWWSHVLEITREGPEQECDSP